MFCAQCGQWMADGQAACERCGAARGAEAAIAVAGAVAGLAQGPAAAPAAVLPEVRYAGFWRRFGVMLVDMLVLFFPTAIVRVAFGGSLWNTQSSFDDPRVLGWTLFNMAVAWLYCSLLESSAAQGTLGQQVFGIRVCDSDLRRISFLRACARHFAQWISLLACGTGYLVNLWTKRRQALHDLIAGCVHVRGESLEARARTEAA
jgi:uncharacterized RDD family membrane protein YckC